MRIPQCDREQQVLDAMQAGRLAGPWGEEVRRHAAGCTLCSEVVLVAEALRREEELSQAQVRLSSAGLVWWKAQLAARRAAEERVTQPIAFVERVARVSSVLAVLGLGVWQWPRIVGFLQGSKSLLRVPETSAGISAALGNWTHQLVGPLALGFGQSPGYLLLMSAGAFLTLVAFAAYAVVREQ
jgi:hypothetical protein